MISPPTLLLIVINLMFLVGCQQQTEETMPPPVAMTEEAVGHFCQMDILEHAGPKAQIHLDGLPYPLFFSQVRDGIAYERMPEQNYKISAIYVSDMSKAHDWENVGRENWIPASSAHYVVASTMTGGMGASELVPFSDQDDARKFVARHGGQIMRLDDIDDALVLNNTTVMPSNEPLETAIIPDDDDYRARLEKLRKE
ncbi:nitrous oxide reductase accessory protein NosL [Thalassospira povalilytica]|uniref:nitrous oxide reductase accessory protein NosL n=1 Tax=Thalassospira povalilytica TaxID=732237 RepID=UPI003AA86A7B